ncbi:MAG: hypothetical protein AAF498_10985 [Pseudomonadota bacterium]
MRRLLIISVLALSGGSAAQGGDTASGTGATELACSGGVRDVIVLGASDERLSVSTIITPAEKASRSGEPVAYDLPAYSHTVTGESGEVILRYGAQGLFNNAGPLSCEERLNAAQRQLVEELMEAERLEASSTGIMSLPVRMSQLSACLINRDACNTEPHYVNPSESLREFGQERFERLLEDEPITFSVFVSDCQRDTYLYDPESRTVLNVESTGC